MTEDEWWHFVASGAPPIVTVTQLPGLLCSAMRAHTSVVKIRHEYTLKILHKHGIQPDKLSMMTLTIEIGRAVLEPRGQCMSFFLFDDVVYGGWFHATIKATQLGDELWVSTFHPTRFEEVARITKRGRLLRPAYNETGD